MLWNDSVGAEPCACDRLRQRSSCHQACILNPQHDPCWAFYYPQQLVSLVFVRGLKALHIDRLLMRFLYVLWAQDEHPANPHMAQPSVPVGKSGMCMCVKY
jgi:hypothetical protein